MPSTHDLAGRRVLITGAARGIGAALARRLHAAGAEVAILGLEPELLQEVAAEVGGPWVECNVADRSQVDDAVAKLVAELGGLDVVVANAGIAKQLPLDGGDPTVMERTLQVNVLGVYYTLRAAAPHINHPGGYALVTSSLAAGISLPLLGAYSASKAAVEALGNTFRMEVRPTGAKVGVAYFAEIDTDMTSRGFGTESAAALLGGGGSVSGVAPLTSAIDALERGITRRSRRICAPFWVRGVLPVREVAQRVVELRPLPRLTEALEMARHENVDFTTAQPDPTRRP
ncbi:SDR family NAD(P)-dependent oxidoreductase [Luteipulveratus mongoliensis]|uniref:Oxidoreductase n=1 Tax=Luteipulveratus mongoliensis TaxID=571913 RepID=A0A0K1JL53_9MICO|nr:SDR family NAD(P)-dependent oxidoreductase [Luteipulveratus mongoliensis]AKU17303.1 oxidoreductase [Luteipulveratus mongoliensis]